jgi:hypothetical protein
MDGATLRAGKRAVKLDAADRAPERGAHVV